jgi:uncharacterized RDD family membrane protein YckC
MQSSAMPSFTSASPLLDTRLRVETPEGVDLLLCPAGPLVRARAFAVDLLLRGALSLLAVILFGRLGDLGIGLGLILLFLLNWGYMALFEALNQGRSPGKQLLGLCVVQEDGTPLSWGSALLRNLLRFVDMLPLGYCCGLLTSLASPRFQRLGDLAAGTLVIHRPRQPAPPPSAPVAALPLPFALSAEEQRAVLAFDERQQQLSPARREELAGLLAPLLGVPPGEAPLRLRRIAAGLRGMP